MFLYAWYIYNINKLFGVIFCLLYCDYIETTSDMSF